MRLAKEEEKMFNEHIGFGESGNFERVSCKSQSTGSVLKRDCWNKCQVCGKFIPYDDIENGKATHRMLTPDSDVSYETWETLCAEHTHRGNKGHLHTPIDCDLTFEMSGRNGTLIDWLVLIKETKA